MLQQKEDLDWRLFFNIFLSRKNIPYALQSNDKEVQLIFDQQFSLPVEETLLNALRSEQGFQSALPYMFQRTSGSQPKDGGQAIKQLSLPEIRRQILADGRVALSIDKKLLLSYLQALTKNRVLFRVYQPETELEPPLNENPIFFSKISP